MHSYTLESIHILTDTDAKYRHTQSHTHEMDVHTLWLYLALDEDNS